MDDILKCKKCDFTCTSEKIFWLHLNECKELQVKTEKEFDYENMLFSELKSLASSKGVNTYKLKKEQLIEQLQALEG